MPTINEQQELVQKNSSVNSLFKESLSKLKKESTDSINNFIYISHGCATENGRPYNSPSWGLSFLETLRQHLRDAGFYPKLFPTDLDYGSKYDFIDTIKKTSYTILLMGTESLLQRHEDRSNGLVLTELNLIRRRARDNPEDHRIYPIVISGSVETAFPAEFQNYKSELDWTSSQGYVRHLFKLIGILHSIESSKVDAILKTFFESLSKEQRQSLDPDYIEQNSESKTLVNKNNSTIKSDNENKIDKKRDTTSSSTSSSVSKTMNTSDKNTTDISNDDDLPPPPYEDIPDDDNVSSLEYKEIPYTQIMQLKPQESTILENPISIFVINPTTVTPTSSERKPTAIEKSIISFLEKTAKTEQQKLAYKNIKNALINLNSESSQLETLIDFYNKLKLSSPTQSLSIFKKNDAPHRMISQWLKENETMLDNKYHLKFVKENKLLVAVKTDNDKSQKTLTMKA